MKKKIIYLLLVIIIMAGAGMYYIYNKPSQKTISEDAHIEVTAEQLYSDFASNEERANRKYLNKILLVTGVLGDVTDDGQTITYSLNTNDAMAAVTCNIEKSTAGTPMPAGSTVKVKGLCTGLLIDVVLVKCSIENNN